MERGFNHPHKEMEGKVTVQVLAYCNGSQMRIGHLKVGQQQHLTHQDKILEATAIQEC